MNRAVKNYLSLTAFGAILLWGGAVRIGLPYVSTLFEAQLGYASGTELAFSIGVTTIGLMAVGYVQQQLQDWQKTRSELDTDARRLAKVTTTIGYCLAIVAAIGAIAMIYFGGSTYFGDHTAARSLFLLVVLSLCGTSIASFGKSLRGASRQTRPRNVMTDLTDRIQSYGVGPDADTVLAKDQRRPVLYLRSFDDEAHRATISGRFSKYWFATKEFGEGFYLIPSKRFDPKMMLGPYRSRSVKYNLLRSKRSMFDEQIVFAEFMDLIGPYIAIGRPTEIFSNMDLGAAKKYVSDEDWQDTIREWIIKSAAIVLDVETSGGLLWEIEQVVTLATPTKVLLILPWQQEHYEAFLEGTSRIFPIPLPDKRPPSRLITFQDAWRPLILTRSGDDISLEGTLRPFVQQNAFILKQLR